MLASVDARWVRAEGCVLTRPTAMPSVLVSGLARLANRRTSLTLILSLLMIESFTGSPSTTSTGSAFAAAPAEPELGALVVLLAAGLADLTASVEAYLILRRAWKRECCNRVGADEVVCVGGADTRAVEKDRISLSLRAIDRAPYTGTDLAALSILLEHDG